MMISGNLAIAMCTLKTSTTKSFRQGSSSHQQLSVHIPMEMLLKCPVASYLLLSLVHLLSYVEIMYIAIIILLVYLVNVALKVPQNTITGHLFSKFSGGMPPDPSSFAYLVCFAFCAQQCTV